MSTRKADWVEELQERLGTVEKLASWLLLGEVGESSKCMAAVLGFGEKGFSSHPYDPSDFQRCLKLLEAVPELRNHLNKMKDVSKYWAKLVDHWNEIECTLHDECGWPIISYRAPKTYALMKEVLES